MIKKCYTFDDVALVPQFNNVPSRLEPSMRTWLTSEISLEIPLLAANMDSVISDELAEVLISRGSIPFFHRFCDLKAQITWVKRFEQQTFVSLGLSHFEEARTLIDAGAKGVCIDVAHGHSDRMMSFIEALKKAHPNTPVIAGNICTPMAYHDLVNAGADAVKVGIGPGASCTTRLITGFGVPQFSAIYECAQLAQKLRVPLIADGGIRSSRDVVLALAAGACTVMIGKLFALTNESASPKKQSPNGHLLAKYRGQASADFQKEFYGQVKDHTVAEGVSFWSPVLGSASEIIDSLLGGLRSGLTYGGARDINELQRKAEFVEVNPLSYSVESNPRDHRQG